MNVGELRRLVTGYLPEDPTELEYHRRLSEFVDSVDVPWDRERFDPGHVTASGFVLHPDRGSVALVHHAKIDRWVQPGGHIEHEDTDHEQAARREVAEECLIDGLVTIGLIDLDIHRFPARGSQPAHLHFDLRWAFRATHDRIAAGDGTLDVRWVPVTELAHMQEEGLVRTARKLFNYADRP